MMSSMTAPDARDRFCQHIHQRLQCDTQKTYSESDAELELSPEKSPTDRRLSNTELWWPFPDSQHDSLTELNARRLSACVSHAHSPSYLTLASHPFSTGPSKNHSRRLSARNVLHEPERNKRDLEAVPASRTPFPEARILFPEKHAMLPPPPPPQPKRKTRPRKSRSKCSVLRLSDSSSKSRKSSPALPHFNAAEFGRRMSLPSAAAEDRRPSLLSLKLRAEDEDEDEEDSDCSTLDGYETDELMKESGDDADTPPRAGSPLFRRRTWPEEEDKSRPSKPSTAVVAGVKPGARVEWEEEPSVLRASQAGRSALEQGKDGKEEEERRDSAVDVDEVPPPELLADLDIDHGPKCTCSRRRSAADSASADRAAAANAAQRPWESFVYTYHVPTW